MGGLFLQSASMSGDGAPPGSPGLLGGGLGQWGCLFRGETCGHLGTEEWGVLDGERPGVPLRPHQGWLPWAISCCFVGAELTSPPENFAKAPQLAWLSIFNKDHSSSIFFV